MGKKLSLLFPMVLLAGCWSQHADSIHEPGSVSITGSVEHQFAEPLAVEVIDEVNDGKDLHILTKILAKASWAVAGVKVRLLTFNHGQLVVTRVFPLAQLLPRTESAAPDGTIPAGRDLQFVLTAPSHDITDYQIELVWEHPPTEAEAKRCAVELRSVATTPEPISCAAKTCPMQLVVTAQVANVGTVATSKVTLGIGFIPKLDLTTQIPQNEAPVVLDVNGLVPQQERPLRLVLEQKFSAKEVEQWRVAVRVLSCQ